MRISIFEGKAIRYFKTWCWNHFVPDVEPLSNHLTQMFTTNNSRLIYRKAFDITSFQFRVVLKRFKMYNVTE